MITCPNCHHEELPGALFCSECGAQLVTSEKIATQSISHTPSDVIATPIESVVPAVQEGAAVSTEGVVISLHLVDSGQVLHLTGRSEFTLGRVAEGQPILPDIDLSPYEAYSQGVSRLHVAIKIVNGHVVISDLGSSNGTRVNGQKIIPHIDYPLNYGDVVALGKLKIQILIHK